MFYSYRKVIKDVQEFYDCQNFAYMWAKLADDLSHLGGTPRSGLCILACTQISRGIGCSCFFACSCYMVMFHIGGEGVSQAVSVYAIYIVEPRKCVCSPTFGVRMCLGQRDCATWLDSAFYKHRPTSNDQHRQVRYIVRVRDEICELSLSLSLSLPCALMATT
jgi:hypothetical protein